MLRQLEKKIKMLTKLKILHKTNIIAIVNVHSTSNNTILNVSDIKNKTIFSGSSGLLGIKGSRRSTSYASQSIANILGKKLYFLGVRYVFIKIKGFGNGRYSSLKGLHSAGLKILSILDVTPMPFNGCKSSKKRRI
jgi:small subunit ribosomal protein S11